MIRRNRLIPGNMPRPSSGNWGKYPYTLILEPGRVIVGNAGILVTNVLYVKKGEEKNFIIVDAGMNDLLRPSLYGSFHQIQPVVRSHRSKYPGRCSGTDL